MGQSHNKMLISIITPTSNSEKTIKRCIQSILSQHHQNYEHIVIDNRSSDRTVSIISEMYQSAGLSGKLTIRSEPDSGVSDAFNKGIRLAKGDVIGILNSDDYFYNENSLERLSVPFQDHSVSYVHGNIYMVDPLYGSGLRRPQLCPVTRAMPFNHPTLYFRKSVYDINGLYDTTYRLIMDYEFMIRLFTEHREIYEAGSYIPGDPLVVMHFGGISWQQEEASLNEIRAALKRHSLWNFDAGIYNYLRYLRLKLRTWLLNFHLTSLVRLWRKWKWRV